MLAMRLHGVHKVVSFGPNSLILSLVVSVSHQLYQPYPRRWTSTRRTTTSFDFLLSLSDLPFFLGHASFLHFYTCMGTRNRRTQSSFTRPSWRPRIRRPR